MNGSKATVLVASILLMALTVSTLVWGICALNLDRAFSILQHLSPLFLEIILALVLIGIVLNLNNLKTIFGTIQRKTILRLALILLAGLAVLIFIVPREHRIYYDEDIYENGGQNIAEVKSFDQDFIDMNRFQIGDFWKRFTGPSGMCNHGDTRFGEYRCFLLEYNKEPNGWSYIISLVYRVFGTDDTSPFIINNVFYVITIISVFLIGFILFGEAVPALWGAFFLAFTPEVIRWSDTAASEPSAMFFGSLAVLAALIFARMRDLASFFLLIAVTALAVQFRPESFMIVAPVLLIIIIWDSPWKFSASHLFFISLFILLIAPFLFHMYEVRGMDWGATGKKMAASYFWPNLKANVVYHVKNMRFPLLYSVFFLLGFAGFFMKAEEAKDYAKRIGPIALWFALFFAIFLFFYAGSYNYGMDVRFSLVSAPAFSIIAAAGVIFFVGLIPDKFNRRYVHISIAILALLTFTTFLSFIRTSGENAWQARYDHNYMEEFARILPDDAIVLTHNPSMFLLRGKNAAQASLATSNLDYFGDFFWKYPGGIYFHFNYWCNVDDEVQKTFCRNILGKYDAELIKSYKDADYTYALYRINAKKELQKPAQKSSLKK